MNAIPIIESTENVGYPPIILPFLLVEKAEYEILTPRQKDRR